MKQLRIWILITALLAAAASASILPKDQRRETIRFVESLQNPDGGFRAGPAAGPSTASTTTAGLRALEHLDGPRAPAKPPRASSRPWREKTAGSLTFPAGHRTPALPRRA
jgi:hypothetical protein